MARIPFTAEQEAKDHKQDISLALPFEYILDDSVTTADVGKLMMDDGSGTAKVYNPVPLIAGSALLTVTAPSTVHADLIQAHFRILFHTQPSVGERIGLKAKKPGGSSQGIFVTFVSGAPGANEVQIGGTIALTISNLITYLGTQAYITQNYANAVSNETGAHSLTIAADIGQFSGANGNMADSGGQQGLVATFDHGVGNYTWGGNTSAPFLNTSGSMEFLDVSYLSIGGTPSVGPQNGADEVAASTINLADSITGDIFGMTAGVDWTPGATAALEATAINAAIQGALINVGWSSVKVSPQITMSNDTPGADTITATLGGTTGWATFTPTNGTNYGAVYKPLGQLASIQNNSCSIRPPDGLQFIVSLGDAGDSEAMAGGPDGTITAADPSRDYIVGFLIGTTAQGQSGLLGWSSNDHSLWAVPPQSKNEAIDRMALLLKTLNSNTPIP